MIAVECPQCGAATPAFPLTPDRVACRACKYEGPPRPEVLEQLRASAHHVGAANAHHARQLGATQLAAQMSLLRNRRRLHTLLVLLILPGLLFGALLVASILDDDPFYMMTIVTGVPLVAFALAVAMGSRALDKQVRDLTDACGAIPPATPGGPAQCHLCGAGLPPATSQGPICRCRHCGTDNVASPELMREIVARRHWVVGQFNRSLSHRGAYLARAGASAVRWVIAVALLSPFVGFAAGIALSIGLDDIRLERVPAQYVLVAHDGAICAALMTDKQDDGSWRLAGSFDGGEMRPTLRHPERYTRVPPAWFIGRTMRLGSSPDEISGPVRDVYTHVLRPRRNHVAVRRKGASDMVVAIEGTCLVDPPPDSVAFAWPRVVPDEPTPSASGLASSTAPAGSTSRPPPERGGLASRG